MKKLKDLIEKLKQRVTAPSAKVRGCLKRIHSFYVSK